MVKEPNCYSSHPQLPHCYIQCRLLGSLSLLQFVPCGFNSSLTWSDALTSSIPDRNLHVLRYLYLYSHHLAYNVFQTAHHRDEENLRVRTQRHHSVTPLQIWHRCVIAARALSFNRRQGVVGGHSDKKVRLQESRYFPPLKHPARLFSSFFEYWTNFQLPGQRQNGAASVPATRKKNLDFLVSCSLMDYDKSEEYSCDRSIECKQHFWQENGSGYQFSTSTVKASPQAQSPFQQLVFCMSHVLALKTVHYQFHRRTVVLCQQ